jgi:hypothetical protein
MHSRRLLPGYALGLAALAYCGVATAANGLYPNQFFATLNAPGAIVSADMNGDGKLDLIELGFDQTIAVLIGKGDGTFASPKDYYVSGNVPEALAVADLNGDGKLDIVVANNADGTIGVLLGNGDGTFKAQTQVQAASGKGTPAPLYAVGTGPISITIADVNNDGHPDIIVANFTDATLSILLNNGNGTFKTQTTMPVGLGPTYVTAADMNRDGKMDLLVNSSEDDSFGVLLGHGDGTFRIEVATRLGPFSTAQALQTMLVGDFQHDGKLDVITTTSDLNAQTVLYFRGEGNGSFLPGRTLTTGRQTAYLAAADVNGDGLPDLIAGSFASSTLRVMFANGNGGFTAGTDYPAIGITGSLTTQAFTVGDFNGDGHPDIASVNSGGSLIQVLYNDGQGHFHLANTYAAGVAPVDVQTADLDGDHHLDLVDLNSVDGTMDVRLGLGDGTFQAMQTYPVGPNPQRLLLVDVNHDGKLDAVTVNFGDGTISVLLGNGDGTFQSRRTFDAGPNAVDLAVGDMDQDGKLDLLVANTVVNTVSILRGNGDGTFKARVAYPAANSVNGLTVGDIDHDGFPDVVTVGSFVSVLRNDRKGGLVTPTFQNSGNSIDIYTATGVRVELRDVNNDREPDILVADSANSQLVVLRGNHLGYFTRVPSDFPTCANPRNLVLGDLNADGELDVAMACQGSSSVGVLLGNGLGGFLNFAYPAELEPRSVAIGDFNEDGQPDLVTANSGSDSLNVLMQIHGVVAKDKAPTALNAPFFIADGNLAQAGQFQALDADGDGVSYVLVTPPPADLATISVSSDGSFLYLAATGVTGITSMQFQATDGVKLSNIATVTINVQKNSSGGGSGDKGHGLLGGFWLPFLPMFGLFAILRRRRRS